MKPDFLIIQKRKATSLVQLETSSEKKGDRNNMKKNEELLEHASFGKLVLNLCVPSIVIMLVMVIYNMADTFFIGQTGDPNKIAAISLCAPLFTILSGLPSPLHSEKGILKISDTTPASAAMPAWYSDFFSPVLFYPALLPSVWRLGQMPTHLVSLAVTCVLLQSEHLLLCLHISLPISSVQMVLPFSP